MVECLSHPICVWAVYKNFPHRVLVFGEYIHAQMMMCCDTYSSFHNFCMMDEKKWFCVQATTAAASPIKFSFVVDIHLKNPAVSLHVSFISNKWICGVYALFTYTLVEFCCWKKKERKFSSKDLFFCVPYVKILHLLSKILVFPVLMGLNSEFLSTCLTWLRALLYSDWSLYCSLHPHAHVNA